jgi:Raf kinase inhibitor-like YbhB/YbcL family protein
LPLQWSSAPAGTKSFVVYMYDLNPVAKNHIHWLVKNIPATVTSFKEGISRTQFMPAGSIELANTSGSLGYEGPCPPVGTGNHQYKVVVLALNTEELKLYGAPTLADLEVAVGGKILGRGEISGYYQQ